MIINAINLYNLKFSDEALGLLMRDKRLQDLGRGKITVALNESDKDVYFVKSVYGWKVKKSTKIVSSEKNIWEVQEGQTLTPFDIYENPLVWLALIGFVLVVALKEIVNIIAINNAANASK